MEDQSERINTEYRAINVLQSAFAAGQLMFSAVVFVLIKDNISPFDPSNVQTIMAAFLMVVLVPLALYMNKKGIDKAKAADGLDRKLALYRSSFIVRSAMLEGCSLFSIITVMLTHSPMNYAFFVISFGAFLSLWITEQKMKADLDIY